MKDNVVFMQAGSLPWSGVGTQILEALSAEEAIQRSGLDWDVEVAPIVTNDQKKTDVDRWRVTRRVQDNTILGVVKRGFTPIQNRDAFRMYDNVVGQKKVMYDTAGALQGGSKVFIASKLPEPLVVGKGIGEEDVVDRYLLLSNAHDGTRPLQIIFTPVRVICENTLSLALQIGKSGDKVTRMAPRVSVRHWNKDVPKAMKEAERTMAAAYKYYEKFGDFANFLYQKQVSSVQLKYVVSEVFPPNLKGEVTPAVFYHRNEIEKLFVTGKGHDKIAGTAWALLQAFTQYADHDFAVKKAREVQDRSYSIIMGGSKGLKQRATNKIYQVFA